MNFLTQQQEVSAQLRLDLNQGPLKTLVQRWLNQAQQEIWAAYDWNFALDRVPVQTTVDQTAGTVSINTGTNSVTGAGTAFTSAMVGYFIQFSESYDWYKISAVADSTDLTIEVPFVGPSNLSAGTYTIRQVFYSAPSNCEKILDAHQAITPAFIDAAYFREFDMVLPNSLSTGNPQVMIVFGLDSSNNIKFSLYPWSSQVQNIEMRYKTTCTDLAADGDVSIIPNKWNSTTMIDGALYRGLNYLGVSNTPMIQASMRMQQSFMAGLQRMKADQDVDESYHPVMNNRDRTVRAGQMGPYLPFKYG